MKKAKSLLAIIAILATIGGLLAYKARVTQKVFYLDPIAGGCSSTLQGFKLTTDFQAFYGYVTNNPTLPCTWTFYTVGL